MKTRAAVLVEHGQPLAIEEIELGNPGPFEVLVKLYASGICHSQLHQIHNPAQARPALLGHEATGVVIAAGRDVTHVKEGDRVMVTWVPRDITPETAALKRSGFDFRGATHLSGVYTWAEHVLTHEQLVLPLDASVPIDVTAIIGCATVTGVGAVLGTAKVQPGQTVAVFGVGGVGINVIAGAKIAQAGKIIAIDIADDKLAWAKEFGATDVVNGKTTDPVEAIRALSGGGVDFAFDAIGMESVINQCLESITPGILGARRGGTAVVVGTATRGCGTAVVGTADLRGSSTATPPLGAAAPHHPNAGRTARCSATWCIEALFAPAEGQREGQRYSGGQDLPWQRRHVSARTGLRCCDERARGESYCCKRLGSAP